MKPFAKPRRMLAWLAGATVFALVSAGCGTGFSSDETAVGPDLIGPALVGDDIVSCIGWALPLSALDNLEPLESRPGIARPVNSFLGSQEGQYWPQSGWHVITVSDTYALAIVLQTEAQARAQLEPMDGLTFEPDFGDGVNDTVLFSLQGVELIDNAWEWNGSESGEDCELETSDSGSVGRLSDFIGNTFGIPADQ